MSLKYDKKLTEIVSRISNKNSLTTKDTDEIITHFFKEMREALKNPEMPEVLVHNFGRFKAAQWRLEKAIAACQKSGNKSREEELQSILDRTIKEKRTRNDRNGKRNIRSSKEEKQSS